MCHAPIAANSVLNQSNVSCTTTSFPPKVGIDNKPGDFEYVKIA